MAKNEASFPNHPIKPQKTAKFDDGEFTEAEVEHLLDKASQPLEPKQKPDSGVAETSESPTSGDCSGSHTHSDSPEGT